MVAIIQYLLMFIAEKYIFQYSFRSYIKVKHIEFWNIGVENLEYWTCASRICSTFL